MTTFLDFVLATGLRRLTIVSNAKAEYGREYSPARDFYKPLREAVADVHLNRKEKGVLDDVAHCLTDERKVAAYRECIRGYKKWWGQKEIEWRGTSPVEWRYGQLVIRVNPELGVSINGLPYAVKLYFKSDKPSKHRLEAMFHLLSTSHSASLPQMKVGILDVRRGNLFQPNRDIVGVKALLAGEATAFQTMWDQV